MKSRLTLTVIAVLGCLAAAERAPAQQSQGINWRHDLEAARAEARQTGKNLLIHFWTPSCGPCRRLDQTVFNQSAVGSALETQYVPVKLNADAYPAIAQQFKITRVPTDVVVTPDGQVLTKTVSPSTPAAYVAKFSGLATQQIAASGQAFQRAVTAATTSGDKRVNPAYANLTLEPEPSPSGVSSEANVAANVPAVIHNQHAMVGGPAATAAPRAPSIPSQSPVAAPAPTSPQVAASTSPNTPVASQVGATQPPTSSSPGLAANPVTAAQRAAATPELPAGSPPLGFGGYCPVSMKTQWQWVPGDTRWGAVHRGRTYLFAGATQQQQFLANPDAFSPALSGADPVAAVDQRVMLDGQREHSLEYNGQFYFFSSEANLQRFTSNPTHYADGVRQAMGGAPGMMRR